MEEIVNNLALVAMAMIMLAITLWIMVLISSSVFEEKNMYEKLRSLLVKAIETSALILVLVLLWEIIVGHRFPSYEGLLHKIATVIRDDIKASSGDDLPTSIGYLQLLVAVITIAIGGIALINFVTGRVAIRKLEDEHKDSVEEINREHTKSINEIKKAHTRLKKRVDALIAQSGDRAQAIEDEDAHKDEIIPNEEG